MDELKNRSRTLAEAVVTMVWLVLLALALNKTKSKSEVAGFDVPNFMPFLAVFTILTGISPLMACFINLPTISNVAALFSAVSLFFLAYWMSLFTVSDDVIVLWVAFVFLSCLVFRISSYYLVETGSQGHPERTTEFHTILDGSHEFSCCMTGIHFLWLESIAFGGLINKSNGIQNALSEYMGITNIICFAIGLWTMYFQMMPPLTSSKMNDIVKPIFWFDLFMILSIGAVLGGAMWKSGWLLLIVCSLIVVGPVVACFVLVLHVSCPEEAGGSQDREPPKLAPLGLTKLMATGFLTVFISIESSDVGFPNWFLVFAAAAIVSGLTWRFLTQTQVKKMLENNKQLTPVSQARIDATEAVASSANTACLFTHTFVAIATVLLMLEICCAKKIMSAAAPAPAPART